MDSGTNVEPELLRDQAFLSSDQGTVVDLGPRNSFETADSTNRVAVCRAAGLTKVTRVEVSRRSVVPQGANPDQFVQANHDRMTEQPYDGPVTTFVTDVQPKPVQIIPVLAQGKMAWQDINRTMGLAMSATDIDRHHLYFERISRDPTDVEAFMLGGVGCEHTRHGFFGAKLVIDGEPVSQTLFEIVKSTWWANPGNSVIAFHDNSSAIKGFRIWTIMPEHPGTCSRFVRRRCFYHLIFTAETHNFPCGIAPLPGAETGKNGGRHILRRENPRGAEYIVRRNGMGIIVEIRAIGRHGTLPRLKQPALVRGVRKLTIIGQHRGYSASQGQQNRN